MRGDPSRRGSRAASRAAAARSSAIGVRCAYDLTVRSNHARRGRIEGANGPGGAGCRADFRKILKKGAAMPTHKRWLGVAVWMLAVVPCRAADVTAIVGATVVHPDRDLPSAVASNSTVIISASRIEAIGPASSTPVPAGATRIDGKGKWVVPGLIDSHVHFFQSGNLYTRPDVADFNAWMPYAKEVERNKARLSATFKVWLASGVTSVVDIGGPFWNFEMRDAAAASPAAPRVAVAGPLISMVDRVKLDLGDPPIIRIASADAARALVQRELERKPD